MDVDDCLRRSCEPMQEVSSTLAIDGEKTSEIQKRPHKAKNTEIRLT